MSPVSNGVIDKVFFTKSSKISNILRYDFYKVVIKQAEEGE